MKPLAIGLLLLAIFAAEILAFSPRLGVLASSSWDSGASPARQHAALRPPLLGQARRRGRRPALPLLAREDGQAAGIAAADPAAPADAGELPCGAVRHMDTRLRENERLIKGVLPNGLRYSIVPNERPPNRFSANLAVHVGSVDEEEDQQGLAHFLEHMLFLGTEEYSTPAAMRKVLGRLGMSQLADANACTDFRTTVYTLSAPTRGLADPHNPISNTHELAARRDTLLRAGVVDAPTTILGGGLDYEDEEEEEEEEAGEEEVEGAGPENNIGVVIGLLKEMMFKARLVPESVDTERGAVLNELRSGRGIHERMAKAYYKQLFGDTMLAERFPIGLEEQVQRFSAEDLERFYRKHYHPANMHLYLVGDMDVEEALAQIEHNFGPQKAPESFKGDTPEGPLYTWPLRGAGISHQFGEPPKERNVVMSHPQINDFALCVTHREPLGPTNTPELMREELIDTMCGLALDFRTDEIRLDKDDPPFRSLSWSYFLSPREQCNLNSVQINAEPRRWRDAVEAGGREIARLAKYGVTEAELDLVRRTLMKGYEQRAEQENSTMSADYMQSLMDSAESGDVFMSATEKYRILSELQAGIRVDEVNKRAGEIYGHFVEACEGRGDSSIFVSFPEGGEQGAHMAGFSAEELDSILAKSLTNVEEYVGTEPTPEFLTDDKEMDEKIEKLKPAFVPTDGSAGEAADSGAQAQGAKFVDEGSGVVLRRLSNGVRITYKKTKFDEEEFKIYVGAQGGRAVENAVEGQPTGAAGLGMELALMSGAGNLGPSALSKYSCLHTLSIEGGSCPEEIRMSICASHKDPNNIRRAMELCYLVLSDPKINPDVQERTVRRVVLAYADRMKKLETLSQHVLISQFSTTSESGADPRLLQLPPDVTKGLTLETMRNAVLMHTRPDNLEVVIVGDFDEEEMERCALRYLGALPQEGKTFLTDEVYDKMTTLGLTTVPRAAEVRVPEDEARTCIAMGFSGLNRWGATHTGDFKELCGKTFPGGRAMLDQRLAEHGGLFLSRCLVIAQDAINARLYQEVREKGGLVYSVHLEWEPYMFMKGGFVSVMLSALPGTVDAAIDKVKEVIRGIVEDGFSVEEFENSVNPIVLQIMANLEDNDYWMSLMMGLQQPRSPKKLNSIRTIPELYQSLDREEVLAVVRAAFRGFEDRLVVVKGEADPSIDEPIVTITSPEQ